MMQDTISDMITRIKNGGKSKKTIIYCKFSYIKNNILNVLKKEGFIKQFKKDNNFLEIYLKYYKNNHVIENIFKISKPSLRIYFNINKINKINDIGIFIISTSIGIITNKEAKRKKIGGEVICYVK